MGFAVIFSLIGIFLSVSGMVLIKQKISDYLILLGLVCVIIASFFLFVNSELLK